jgi:hypothetical protein
MLQKLRATATDTADRRLIDYLIAHEAPSALKLEKKSVPMLLISRRGASAISEDDLATTAAYHGIDDQHIEHLAEGLSAQAWMQRIVHAWIDDFIH